MTSPADDSGTDFRDENSSQGSGERAVSRLKGVIAQMQVDYNRQRSEDLAFQREERQEWKGEIRTLHSRVNEVLEKIDDWKEGCNARHAQLNPHPALIPKASPKTSSRKKEKEKGSPLTSHMLWLLIMTFVMVGNALATWLVGSGAPQVEVPEAVKPPELRMEPPKTP